MVAIRTHLHQYAPMVQQLEEVNVPSINKTVHVTTACVQPILAGGDQLTVTRTRGAQKAKANALTPTSRLEGLLPMVEDTKVTLLTVGYNYYLCMTVAIYLYWYNNTAKFVCVQ